MRQEEHKIAPQFKSYIDRERKLLPVDIKDIEIDTPPANNSHTTAMELEDLVALGEEAKLPEEHFAST